MLEADYVKKIKKALDKLPGVCIEKRHGSVYGKAGQPDISGCVDGRRFEIEVKTDENKPTPLQLTRLKEWNQAGAAVAVAWDKEFYASKYWLETKTFCEAIVCIASVEGIVNFVEGARPC